MLACQNIQTWLKCMGVFLGNCRPFFSLDVHLGFLFLPILPHFLIFCFCFQGGDDFIHCNSILMQWHKSFANRKQKQQIASYTFTAKHIKCSKNNKCQIRKVRKPKSCQWTSLSVTSLCHFACCTWRMLCAENWIARLRTSFFLEYLCLGIFFPLGLQDKIFFMPTSNFPLFLKHYY